MSYDFIQQIQKRNVLDHQHGDAYDEIPLSGFVMEGDHS
jgi:hypothetical protein